MKRYLSLLLLTFVVSVFAARSNAEDALPFHDMNVTLKLSDTPIISVENYGNSTTKGAKWLAVEATYYAGTTQARNKRTAIPWLDDVEMECTVLFNTTYQRQSVVAVFSGRSQFWAVGLDGKRHRAAMYIPARILERYTPPGTKLVETMFVAYVKFQTKERSLLGEGYYPTNDPSEQVKRMFRAALAPVGGNFLRLPGTVLSRSKTPWAYLDYDAYEMSKEEKTN